MKAAIASALLAFSVAVVAGDTPGAEMPGWMTGAWARSDGEKWADEYWTPPRGGMMIGASRSGNGEKLQFFEHMRIIREEDGLVFVAIAGDQKPVRFVAVASTESGIVFENREHDYPQRIRYWREGKMLKAEISLSDGSKANGFSFDARGE